MGYIDTSTVSVSVGYIAAKKKRFFFNFDKGFAGLTWMRIPAALQSTYVYQTLLKILALYIVLHMFLRFISCQSNWKNKNYSNYSLEYFHFSLSILAAFFQQIIEKIYITFIPLPLFPLTLSLCLSVCNGIFIKQPLPSLAPRFWAGTYRTQRGFPLSTFSHNWQFSHFLIWANALSLSLFLAPLACYIRLSKWVLNVGAHCNSESHKTHII